MTACSQCSANCKSTHLPTPKPTELQVAALTSWGKGAASAQSAATEGLSQLTSLATAVDNTVLLQFSFFVLRMSYWVLAWPPATTSHYHTGAEEPPAVMRNSKDGDCSL